MSYKLYKIFIRNFFSEKIFFHDLVRSLHSLKFSRILIPRRQSVKLFTRFKINGNRRLSRSERDL